jgi:hypothetical protein
MKNLSRLWTPVAIGAALSLAGCGASPEGSLATPSAITADDGGAVVASGCGSGSVASPGAGPGDGTCTAGCSGAGPGQGAGPGDGLCGAACVGPVTPGPADLVEILDLALQEEYRAEALYRSVLEDFGATTQPFGAIAGAEATHVEALKRLIARREWAAPASLWETGSFPTFDSLSAACAAGVQAEKDDAAFYDRYLVPRDDLPQDVVTVFTNLRAASLENHLPAFERCQ